MFLLADEYLDDYDYLEIVDRYKGSDYMPKKAAIKSEKNIQESEDIFLSGCSIVKLRKNALRCKYLNKYDNHCMKDKSGRHYCSLIRNVKNQKCIMQKRLLMDNSIK